jgi:hypothetical protein
MHPIYLRLKSVRAVARETSAVALTLGLAICAAAAAEGTGNDDRRDDDRKNEKIIYSSIPKPLPGNVASVGPEAYAFREVGDGVVFVPGAGGTIDEVKVILSSWGCPSGHWYSNDCVTPRDATFKQPITLNVYAVIEVGGVPTQGSLLATMTKTFDIRYRPSADPIKCPSTPGKWHSQRDKTCYNGLAMSIEFDLASKGVVVPNKVIVGVTYNTSHYGYAPIGEAVPCFTSSGGCPYDSLNVSTDGAGAKIGSVIDPNGIFINYTSPASYCPPHVDQGNVMQLDNANGCWAGFHPQIAVESTGRARSRGRKDDPAD